MKGLDKIAYLSNNNLKRLDAEGLGTLIRESFLAKFQDAGLKAWSNLPLVIRVKTSTVKGGRKKHPTRTIDLAPPGANLELPGKNGSYLLLDVTRHPGRLTVVLFDWDTLSLNRQALDTLGIDSARLASLLRARQEPAPRSKQQPGPAKERQREDRERSKRWRVRDEGEALEITSGDWGSEEVSPIVGRLFLGTLAGPRSRPGDQDEIQVEILALPRLVKDRSERGEVVALDGDQKGAQDFLEQTVWRRGAPNFLLALLKLAHGAPPFIGPRRVELSTTEDPSPLAWLALVDALERAAEHQRRQYTRVDQTVRVPSGTIRFNAYIGNLARQQPERVPVSRHVLSRDTLENRLFKGMARRLWRRLREPGPLATWLRGRLETLEATFHQCADVEPKTWMCDELLARPMPQVLVEAVKRSRDELNGRYPGLTLEGGSQAQVEEFEIDIAELFESAMRTVLSQAYGAPVVDGNMKPPLAHSLSWSGSNTGSIRLKPDFAVMDRDEVVLVGDAKYKHPFADNRSSFRPLLRADFQQVCTYLLAWPKARRGVVLMPAEEDAQGNFATQRLATLSTGKALDHEQKLAVFQVDVTKWNARKLHGEPLADWLAASAAG